MKTVFLSSVAKGFEDYRRSVYQSIQGLRNCKCISMEDFGAQDSTSVDVCKAAVANCDIFVGLFGPHYGSYVPGTFKSFTELEYETAVAMEKNRFLYFTAENFSTATDSVEPDEKRAKQQALWERALKDRQVARFDDAEKLGRLVVQAIYNHNVLSEAPTEQSHKPLYDSEHIRKSTSCYSRLLLIKLSLTQALLW